jgi:biotin carboxyl carrier protein
MSSLEFLFEGEVVDATVERRSQAIAVTTGGREIVLLPAGENLFSAQVNGRKVSIAAVRHKDRYYVDIDSVLVELSEPSAEMTSSGVGDAGEADKIYAPMPGKVVKILVEVGQDVAEKTPMVIVEAMKMENQVNAKAKGKVIAVNFKAGDQVDTETPIIELELEAAEGESG